MSSETSNSAKRDTLQAQLKTVDIAYQSRDQHREKVEDYNRILDIKAFDAKLIQGLLKFDKLQNNLREGDHAFVGLKAQIDSADKEVRELKKTLPDVAQLSAIQQWFTQNQHLHENRKALRDELADNEKKQQDLESQKEQLLSSDIALESLDPRERTFKINEIKDVLKDKIERLTLEIKHLDQKLVELSGSEKLVEFVRRVQDDTPCPLCGSTHHPQVLKIEDVSDAKKQVNDEKLVATATISALSAIIEKLNMLYGFFKTEFETHKVKADQLKTLEERIEAHKQGFIWTGYNLDDEQKVSADMSKASKQKQDISDKEKTLDGLNMQLERARESLDVQRKELETVKTNNAQFIAQKSTLVNQLKQLKVDDYTQVDPLQIQKTRDELQHSIETAESSYKVLTTQLTDMTRILDQIVGQRAEKENQLKQLQSDYAQTTRTIDERMKQHGFTQIEDIRAILAENLNSEKEQQEIAEYNTLRQTKQAEKNMLEVQLSGKTSLA